MPLITSGKVNTQNSPIRIVDDHVATPSKNSVMSQFNPRPESSTEKADDSYIDSNQKIRSIKMAPIEKSIKIPKLQTNSQSVLKTRNDDEFSQHFLREKKSEPEVLSCNIDKGIKRSSSVRNCYILPPLFFIKIQYLTKYRCNIPILRM